MQKANPNPDPNTGKVLWVELVPRPGTNDIALLYADANADPDEHTNPNGERHLRARRDRDAADNRLRAGRRRYRKGIGLAGRVAERDERPVAA